MIAKIPDADGETREKTNDGKIGEFRYGSYKMQMKNIKKDFEFSQNEDNQSSEVEGKQPHKSPAAKCTGITEVSEKEEDAYSENASNALRLE